MVGFWLGGCRSRRKCGDLWRFINEVWSKETKGKVALLLEVAAMVF